MTRVNIHRGSLEYDEHGKGQPLVFVHGSASDYRSWPFQQDVLSRHFRTIVYSRRYHWSNERIPEDADYSIPEHVDDLRTLLVSLDATPAHLVGHSYGAFLCLLLAIREPDIDSSLVVPEPPVVPLFVSNPPKLLELEIVTLVLSRPRTAIAIMRFGVVKIAPATKAAERDDMETAMHIFGSTVLGRHFYGRLSDSRLEQVRAIFIQVEFFGSGFAQLSAEKVRRVQIPTLLVGGQHSPGLFHCLTDRFEELLPHTERIAINGASHIVHEDNAPACNQAVLPFLEKHHQTAEKTVGNR